MFNNLGNTPSFSSGDTSSGDISQIPGASLFEGFSLTGDATSQISTPIDTPQSTPLNPSIGGSTQKTDGMQPFHKFDKPSNLTRTPVDHDPGFTKEIEKPSLKWTDESGVAHESITPDNTDPGFTKEIEKPSLKWTDESGVAHESITPDNTDPGFTKKEPNRPDFFQKDEQGNLADGYVYEDSDGNQYYYSDGKWTDSDGNNVDPATIGLPDEPSTSPKEASPSTTTPTPSGDGEDVMYQDNTGSQKTNNNANGTQGTFIKLDENELESKKDAFNAAAESLASAWQDIKNNQIPAIQSSWAEKDSKAYTDNVISFDPKLEAAVEALRLLSATFENASNELTQTQDEVIRDITSNK